MGPQSFCVSGPMLWNLLPLEIRYHEQTLELFKAKLKNYVFNEAYSSWLFKWVENCANSPVMDIWWEGAIQMIFWIELNWMSRFHLHMWYCNIHVNCSFYLHQLQSLLVAAWLTVCSIKNRTPNSTTATFQRWSSAILLSAPLVSLKVSHSSSLYCLQLLVIYI